MLVIKREWMTKDATLPSAVSDDLCDLLDEFQNEREESLASIQLSHVLLFDLSIHTPRHLRFFGLFRFKIIYRVN